jgi:pentatricopeptide repeat protein
MRRLDVQPNVNIYNMLINGYLRDSKLQEAFQLHDEMLNRGIMPDHITDDILAAQKSLEGDGCADVRAPI